MRAEPPLILFVAAPLLARAYAITCMLAAGDDIGSWLSVSRGFVSDAAVGVIAATLASVLARRGPLRLLVWLGWASLMFLNVDHVYINDANLSLSHLNLALTKQFLLGSVLSLRSGLNMTLLFGASAFTWWLAARSRVAGPRRWLGPVSAAVLGLLVLLPVRIGVTPEWTPMNVVEDDARRLLARPHHPRLAVDTDGAKLDEFFTQDLAGTPIIDYPRERQNVLLIVLESVAQWMLTPERMPGLAALAREQISYTDFVSLQRQSNRGLYALLCADYDNYLSVDAKSDVLASGGFHTTCLPEVLADNGYKTLFLQGTSLGFMQIGRFAAIAGFGQALGNEDLASGYSRNWWGVDDGTLFEEALTRIGALRRSPSPWFVTVFTSGTHHPFNVPGVTLAGREQALAYLDRTLGSFLARLGQSGALDGTLVLITADEASGGWGRGVARQLAMNHAPLVAIPSRLAAPIRQEGIFTQRDVALSVCDYLGLGPGEFPGRSVFRTYPRDRSTLFGNVYSSWLFGYLAGGALYAYSQTDDLWFAFHMPAGRLFAPPLARRPPDSATLIRLQAAFARNERALSKLPDEVAFREAGTNYQGARWLVGDLRLRCQRGDRVHWRVRIAPTTPASVSLRVDLEEGFGVGFLGEHFITTAAPIVKQVSGEGGAALELDLEYEASRDGEVLKSNIRVGPSACGPFAVEEVVIERRRPRA